MDTEKSKMLKGLLYQAFDEELVRDRYRAHDLVYEYNRLKPSDISERERVLVALLGEVGDTFYIEPPFFCDYGSHIRLGENFYANTGCTILDEAEVVFGENVLLGPHVSIYTAGHPFDTAQRNAGWEYARPVTIGNHVWIGGNTIILPGVSIGDNTVIGAGSVVTSNIPAGVVAAGNPCRVIRRMDETAGK